MLEGATLEQGIVLPMLVVCITIFIQLLRPMEGRKHSRLVAPNHLGEMDDLTLEQGAQVWSNKSTKETSQNSP